MESVTQVQILDEAVCVSFYANALNEVINTSILSPPIGK